MTAMRMIGCVGALVFLLPLGASGEDDSPSITLSGRYTRGRAEGRGSGLKAVLKAVKENEYTVTFTAQWQGRETTYTGTLKGDLKDGEITGTAKGRDRRAWGFRGATKDGVMTCKHYDTSRGEERLTGEFVLK